MIIREVSQEELKGFELVGYDDGMCELLGIEEDGKIVAAMEYENNTIHTIEAKVKGMGYGSILVEFLQEIWDTVVAKNTIDSVPYWLSLGFTRRGINMVWECEYEEGI